MYTHIYVKHFSFSLVTWQRALSLTFHNNSLVVHFFFHSYGSAKFFISAPCFIFVIIPNTGLKIYINMHETKKYEKKRKKIDKFLLHRFWTLFFPGPLHKAWFCNCAFELWLDMHSNHMSWLLLFQVHTCTDIRYYIFRIKSHVNLTIELFNKRIISSAIL